jgi:hypothetical protein
MILRDGTARGRVGVRPFALPIVEVEEHRRALRGCEQHVLEFAEDVRANDIALIGGNQVAVSALADEDVEVVEPEVGEHLFKLTIAVNGAQQLAGLQFAVDHGFRMIERDDGLALLRREAGEQRLPFRIGNTLQHVVLLGDRQSEDALHASVRG